MLLKIKVSVKPCLGSVVVLMRGCSGTGEYEPGKEKNHSVRPASIDPMTAVIQRVKGFAYYSLSFHDTTRTLKWNTFSYIFYLVISSDSINEKGFNDICASFKYETNYWLFFSALFNTLPAQM